MKVVIAMKNNEIVIIYKDINKAPELRKIKNDISEFEKLLGRRNILNTI